MALGQRMQHVAAQGALVQRERGGGNVDDDAGSLPDELGDGIALVEALGPEILVVPGVFADGDAEFFRAERINELLRARLEIARFVKDVVGRQKDFALLEHHAAAADQSEEHTSELQSQSNLVCRLLLEK